MTYQEIEKACAGMKTMDFKGKDYALVPSRVKAFRQVCPEGSIITDIVSLENGVVTIKATITNGDIVLATGIAQEKEGSSYINKTSYIENCETSAIGRALGFCGFGIDASIASAEELMNAVNNQGNKATPEKDTGVERAEMLKLINENSIDPAGVAKKYKRQNIHEMTPSECKKAIEWINHQLESKAKAKETADGNQS